MKKFITLLLIFSLACSTTYSRNDVPLPEEFKKAQYVKGMCLEKAHYYYTKLKEADYKVRRCHGKRYDWDKRTKRWCGHAWVEVYYNNKWIMTDPSYPNEAGWELKYYINDYILKWYVDEKGNFSNERQ